VPPLSGEVSIPHVGKFPKAAVVIGVGGVIVLIYYQSKKNAAAAASTAAAATGPNATDPNAGAGYYGGGGSYATGLQSSASYPWDGTYNNTSDPYSMDSATGQTYGTEGYSGSVSSYSGGTSGPPFSTNAQWSQYVLSYYSGSDNLQALTDAIGLYLNGGTVSAAQQGLINDATAIGGTPPVAGPNGYPPSIRTAGSTAGGTGVTGGAPVASVSGGHVISVNNNDAVVAWSGTGATSYSVTRTGPGGTVTNTTSVPQAAYSGLAAGHNYSVRVQPLVNGKPSGKAGIIDFQTTKGK
jgi:hypothetical protein